MSKFKWFAALASSGFVATTEKKAKTEIPESKKSGEIISTKYLIIGGGTAGYTALKTLKNEADRRYVGPVTMITEEKYPPYMRPPLSKQLWNDPNASDFKFTNFDGDLQSLFYKELDFYNENVDVTLKCSDGVTKIDPFEKKAFLKSGSVVSFDKCLLATGGCPKELSVFSSSNDPVVKKCYSVFRTLDDFFNLREIAQNSSRIVFVGGGYLGSELAIALAGMQTEKNLEVLQIIPESGYMGLVLPPFLSSWVGKKVEAMGIKFREGTRIVSVKPEVNGNEQVELELTNGEKVVADHVVVAVGIEPNTNLGSEDGLEIDRKLGGYFVNSELQSSVPDVYVAGDACSFYDTKMKVRRRVEHHDHAVVSGRLAARNMLSSSNVDGSKSSTSPEAFHHQSMFWGDLSDQVGYEAIGMIDSKFPVKAYFKQPNGPPLVVESGKVPQANYIDMNQGVLFYLEPESGKASSDGYRRIVGVLCWNIFGKIPHARNIIGQNFAETETDKLVQNFIN